MTSRWKDFSTRFSLPKPKHETNIRRSMELRITIANGKTQGIQQDRAAAYQDTDLDQIASYLLLSREKTYHVAHCLRTVPGTSSPSQLKLIRCSGPPSRLLSWCCHCSTTGTSSVRMGAVTRKPGSLLGFLGGRSSLRRIFAAT